jgi:hypothetical protein
MWSLVSDDSLLFHHELTSCTTAKGVERNLHLDRGSHARAFEQRLQHTQLLYTGNKRALAGAASVRPEAMGTSASYSPTGPAPDALQLTSIRLNVAMSSLY